MQDYELEHGRMCSCEYASRFDAKRLAVSSQSFRCVKTANKMPRYGATLLKGYRLASWEGTQAGFYQT
jgi:hypothetical protein